MADIERDLSEMKVMWVLAMFDLPVKKKDERRIATRFRKHLLSKGFTMLQFSVYAKFCSSRDSATSLIGAIKTTLPEKGHVRIALVTDKQFGEMFVFEGMRQLNRDDRQEDAPDQLMLF